MTIEPHQNAERKPLWGRVVVGSIAAIGLVGDAFAVGTGEFHFRGHTTVRAYEPYPFWIQVALTSTIFASLLWLMLRRPKR